MFVNLSLNAKMQPIHRHDLEDKIETLLEESGIGFIDAGTTTQDENGEIKSCNIEIQLNNTENAIERLVQILDTINLPKGSKIETETKNIPIGNLEGLAIYINHKAIEDKSHDIEIIDAMALAVKDIGQLWSYWKTPEETALYFYGDSYEKMKKIILGVESRYPSSTKSKIIQIA